MEQSRGHCQVLVGAFGTLSLVVALTTWAGADRESAAASPGIAPTVIVINDAQGPPAETCESVLAKLPKPKTSKARRSRRKQAPPDTTGMVQIAVNAANPDLKLLPGGVPEELPVQPIEGSPATLAGVAAVLHKAESGARVRLSFFGASHTEGDLWTGRVRQILQGRYGDLGHGFILPAALVPGYRASDINLCRSPDWLGDWAEKRRGRKDGLLGFSGLSVSSSSMSSFGWIESTGSGLGDSFSRVELFTLGQPGGGSLQVRVDQTPPVKVSTTADSARLLRTQLQLPDGPHRVVLRPQGDGETRVLGMSVERDGVGVLVDAIGVRGATAASWLEWNQTMLQQGLAAIDPDLIVLAYGTNEASHRSYTMTTYRRELQQVVARLRQAAPGAVCILVGPSDRGVSLGKGKYAIWDRTEPVAEVQREVAREQGCAFWDWQQATGGPGSMVAWYLHQPQLASEDLIHHSRAGYELVAERFVAALDAVSVQHGDQR
jgi:lysophospholipase L1-like esterase